MEEFTGEPGQPQEPATQVLDLDEDGPEALAQFGLKMEVV